MKVSSAGEVRPPQPRRRRGRPSVVDEVAIAAAAMRIWNEHGFAATGWREIAEATGVSSRTLLRHFATRADIAWVGVAPAVERLKASFGRIDPHAPLNQALRLAIVESVSHSDDIRRLGPDWARLIQSEPELLAAAPRAYEPWTVEVAAFIQRRNPDAPAAICHALAVAYQAAAFAAISEWAEEGADGHPDTAVDDMLCWLQIHNPIREPNIPRRS